MKTVSECKDMIYQKIAASPLKTAISGEICKDRRPQNSDKENIVIGMIDLSDGSVQQGTINVNIYVPDKDVTINGRVQKQPNGPRLRELSRMALNVLKEIYFEDCSFWVANQSENKEPNLDCMFANLRGEIRVYETE